MPVKTDSQNSTVDSTKKETAALSKREIKMPDGRYMIFYSEKNSEDAKSQMEKKD